jgi:hypothetical protein
VWDIYARHDKTLGERRVEADPAQSGLGDLDGEGGCELNASDLRSGCSLYCFGVPVPGWVDADAGTP